jgi:energy-coupling factor transport system ATP-binding protein
MSGVTLREVSLSYGGETSADILNSVNLTFCPGELTVISGQSGTGKSTLLSCINGTAEEVFDAAVTGEVLVNGVNIRGTAVGEIARCVGTVLQDAEAQLFNLQAEDEIAFGCENLGVSREDIKRRIDTYGKMMGVKTGSFISRLSGGEKQRLLTASVLAMEQDILLLDEPFANIDGAGTAVLLPYLRGEADRGRTIIVVEHRLDVVLPFADRLVWLEAGRVAEDINGAEAAAWFHSRVEREKGRKRSGPLSETFEKNGTVYSLDDVSAGYGAATVLRNLTLTIKRRENVVVLGENGGGKTTLLKLLGGLIKPKRGQIQSAAKTGFVFQNPGRQLFMDTVRREVDFLSGDDEEWTEELLGLFGLSDLSKRHPFSLSEGQKRLVTVAASAAGRPEVLLLDEPTVGQDFKSLDLMLSGLSRLKEMFGTSCVFTTHDYRAAFALADRTVILKNGRVNKIGGPEIAENYFSLV